MGLGRVGTLVSDGKKKSGSTKPKERRDLIGGNFIGPGTVFLAHPA